MPFLMLVLTPMPMACAYACAYARAYACAYGLYLYRLCLWPVPMGCVRACAYGCLYALCLCLFLCRWSVSVLRYHARILLRSSHDSVHIAHDAVSVHTCHLVSTG